MITPSTLDDKRGDSRCHCHTNSPSDVVGLTSAVTEVRTKTWHKMEPLSVATTGVHSTLSDVYKSGVVYNSKNLLKLSFQSGQG